MTEWIVRRWVRFGHDRLYAATPGGTDLGYLDLATGRYHSDDLSNLPLLRKAIEDHMGARRHGGSVREPNRQPQGNASPTASPAGTPVAPPTLPTPLSPTPLAQSPGPVAATAPVPPPATAPPLTTAPSTRSGLRWHDLSDTRAGAAARERALAEREAQGMVRHMFARVFDAKTDERAWRIGADGEQAVGDQLAALDARWRILHAVRVGERGADIDHVVIGPGGVFTVNSKNHPKASIWVGGDTFMVNGSRVPYIRNSRHEARRASRLLAEHVGFPVPVTGVIAVVGARRGFTVKNQPIDGAVTVVTRRGIRRYLTSQPQRLGLREIDAIHEVARRSTTWHR
ncbi:MULTISPECIES: nuclease-related domain-containing protein [unclassified Dietzia]|uniref:nuclease-related domain-containing protein n=1 Tax=unclassified Dietzia TaxID=2617939 RepID=UPI002814FB3D|nr:MULTISPECIES: nuclease-related domain-containing protein [unclassified Dietzia]